MFFASACPAAANDAGLPSVTIARTVHPTNESSIKTSVEIESECFTGYFTDIRSVINDRERRDMPAGSVNECFEEPAPLALHKDGDKIIWSLAPSLAKLSLNPIDDSKKLPLLLLQYSFWF